MKSKILNLTTDRESLYLKCFKDNNSPKDPEILSWQFFKNGNKNFVDIEFDEEKNKVAAIYATFSVKFRINNLAYLGSQSLDTITDVDYRGKGLFIKLAKGVYQKAEKESIVLVYGFPNGNSINGFTKKLDWQVLDPVPFLIKPLKSSYFTSKVKFLKYLPSISLSFSKFKNKSNYKLSNEFIFQENVNALWTKFSQHFKVSVTRDAAYLKWRYIENP